MDDKVEIYDLEKEKWKKQVSDNKTLVFFLRFWNISYLKLLYFQFGRKHNRLEISLSPSVSPSLRIISTKYDIRVTIRLWTYYTFHKPSAMPLLLLHWHSFA
jgi:hypothetical protein